MPALAVEIQASVNIFFSVEMSWLNFSGNVELGFSLFLMIYFI